MRIYLRVCLSLLGLSIMLSGCQLGNHSTENSSASSTISTHKAIQVKKIATPTPTPKPKLVDWTQPSGGAYPHIAEAQEVWIDVSISKQRVYIKEGQDTLYTMVTSSGMNSDADTSTPLGTFYVEPERGDWFYNAKDKEGAQYWVSWQNHGEFLFHSVAMDEDQRVIESEAKKLGHQASHGCLRLTIPDAKWIYDHIKLDTKVVIHD